MQVLYKPVLVEGECYRTGLLKIKVCTSVKTSDNVSLHCDVLSAIDMSIVALTYDGKTVTMNEHKQRIIDLPNITRNHTS